ncbi:MAG: histidinol-phosphate transaminase [Elusimicrobiota bacterium]
MKPYFPGKPIAEVKRELGLKRVVKLASNENFLGSSPKALAAARRAVRAAHHYPEGASPLLRRALADSCGLQEANVIIGNGSDEVARLLCETMLSVNDEVVCSQYAFIRFKQQAMLMGAKVIEAPMQDWTHDLKVIGQTASSRTKMVFVASPNNPTGTYNTKEQVQGLLKALSPSTILVLDEAYYHYAIGRPDYPDTIPGLVKKHPNLFVMRTFSKAYGLAGFRVGYGVGDAELINWIDRIRMPFNVNLPAQEAALAALRDSAFLKKSVSLTRRNLESLSAELKKLGLSAGESAANFLFVHSPIPGRELFKQLLHKGVIVRSLDEYGLPNHVRISVGSKSENRFLLKALREVLAPSAENNHK